MNIPVVEIEILYSGQGSIRPSIVKNTYLFFGVFDGRKCSHESVPAKFVELVSRSDKSVVFLELIDSH